MNDRFRHALRQARSTGSASVTLVDSSGVAHHLLVFHRRDNRVDQARVIGATLSLWHPQSAPAPWGYAWADNDATPFVVQARDLTEETLAELERLGKEKTADDRGRVRCKIRIRFLRSQVHADRRARNVEAMPKESAQTAADNFAAAKRLLEES